MNCSTPAWSTADLNLSMTEVGDTSLADASKSWKLLVDAASTLTGLFHVSAM